jgi:hypothetical protein
MPMPDYPPVASLKTAAGEEAASILLPCDSP